MTKIAKIKNLIIGNGNPIAIQSMTNVSVTDVQQTLRQIEELQNAGCDIVRIAVPNAQSAEAFAQVRKQTNMPLVADIHFDYRLAIKSIEAGADKIRINPGNVGIAHLPEVIDCAKAHDVAIRLGVNAGSVDKQTLLECNNDKQKALVKNLSNYVTYFEQHGFDNLVLSVKSSDIKQTIALNKAISTLGYPMHVGITEAGLIRQGLVKNAIGIGALLLDGIGDTIRVSLTDEPVEEVYAAKDILRSLGLYKGVQFVSCPKCGRCSIDLQQLATKVYDYVKNIDTDLKIAVMGCEVNGPGECKDADLGIAGNNSKCVFFKKGVVYKTVDYDKAFLEFTKEIDQLIHDN